MAIVLNDQTNDVTIDGVSVATESEVSSAIAAIPAVPDATETIAGKVELATTAEVQAGTDTVRAVTPAGFSAASLGQGQTWQNVKASRALDVVYTNSTGKPIMINVMFTAATAGIYNITKIEVDGFITASYFINYDQNSTANPSYHSVIIPPNCTYKALKAGNCGDITLQQWAELR